MNLRILIRDKMGARGYCYLFNLESQEMPEKRYSISLVSIRFVVITPTSTICWLAIMASVCWGSDTTIVVDQRPNIVWLISEDNSKHFLKLFDEHGAETPHISKLAKHGLIFDRAFSNAPVCSVARTTLMTGCYAPRIGTQYHRRTRLVPLPHGVAMFPTYLRQAGYYTTNRRKTDYNSHGGRAAWDESSRNASWRNRKPGQPFFHMQTFTTTHEGSLHFPSSDVQSKPTQTDPQSVFVNPRHPNTELFKYTTARYHDRIKLLDAQIGKVIDQLSDDDLLDDTFIFYFADHGGVLPGSKGYAYETGLHIPMVVRVPKSWQNRISFNPSKRIKGFVSFIDFGPTVLNLAGVDVPRAMDGQPFLGNSVSMADVQSREVTFSYADRFDEKIDFVRAIRVERFKYIRSYQPFNIDGLQNNYRYRMAAYSEWRDLYRLGELNKQQSLFFECRSPESLYDLDADPYETKNLADDPKYQTQLESMRGALAQKVRRMPDLSFFPESHLAKHAFGDPVAFGRSNRQLIVELADIADLAFGSFDEVRSDIQQALESEIEWKRYWGLIVCSCFGKAAATFCDKAESMLARDSNRLVRVRAAEFLALIQARDTMGELKQLLSRTDSPIEANEILNTIVLLRDGQPGYSCKIESGDLPPAVRDDKNVKRRLEYLTNPKPGSNEK